MSKKSETISTMRHETHYDTLSEALRAAIVDSGMSLRQIAEETGLRHPSISRFLAGKTSLRLDLADRLAEFFGLQIIRTTPAKRNQREGQ